MPSTIRLHRVLRAAPERVYRAFLDADAMAKWLPPYGFTGKVHHLDAKVGGTHEMSFTNFTTGKSHSFGGRYLELKPNEPRVYTSASGFYNRQGNFEKTIGALEKAADLNPQDPQGFFMVSTYYWEKAQKDHTLPPKVKKEYIMRGISYTDRALALNPDYMEALTYKNILLRMQANTETDRKKIDELLKQADELRNKAIELGKKKATTGGDQPAKK